VTETFLPDPTSLPAWPVHGDGTAGGPVKSAAFYGWNPYLDDEKYTADFRAKLVASPSALSILIDTGRNA
jgi:cellulase/cellobiase CelA1